MRFHLPALVGQPVKHENSSCAYTAKIWKFAKMMTERGHEVFIYGGGGCDAPGATYVPTYGARQAPIDFDPMAWRNFNRMAGSQIVKRAGDSDFLLLIAGTCQKELTELLPHLRAVEFGIGYGGSFADFRVFESYAWMHATYAVQDGPNIHDADGRFFDAVIPNYFDRDDFPGINEARGNYLLFVGRMISRKGIELAGQIATAADLPLYVAGSGNLAPSVPDLRLYGPVGPEQRAELMSDAIALLAPTYYLEPFGGVVVEAQMCGCPTITTDWGAFPETVRQGITGMRCRTMGEFLHAVDWAESLTAADRSQIRSEALSRYSLQAIAPRYERYFERLRALDHEGFYDAVRVSGLPAGA